MERIHCQHKNVYIIYFIMVLTLARREKKAYSSGRKCCFYSVLILDMHIAHFKIDRKINENLKTLTITM